MFDISYKTRLELIKGMREAVRQNPIETNLRTMGNACMETYNYRTPEDKEDHSLYVEALYWYRRLNEEYPKEEYADNVRWMEAHMPEGLRGYRIDELINFWMEHMGGRTLMQGKFEDDHRPGL